MIQEAIEQGGVREVSQRGSSSLTGVSGGGKYIRY